MRFVSEGQKYRPDLNRSSAQSGLFPKLNARSRQKRREFCASVKGEPTLNAHSRQKKSSESSVHQQRGQLTLNACSRQKKQVRLLCFRGCQREGQGHRREDPSIHGLALRVQLGCPRWPAREHPSDKRRKASATGARTLKCMASLFVASLVAQAGLQGSIPAIKEGRPPPQA